MENAEIDEHVDEINAALEEAARQDQASLQGYRTFPDTWTHESDKLAAALAAAQGEVTNAAKTKEGYNYKYATLDGIIDIIREPMSKNGLCVIQSHELIKGENPSVVTHTKIMHESGQWHRSSIELPIKQMSQLTPAQMIGVNCTYGRRYALQSLFLLAGEDDTDGTLIT